MKKFKYYCEVIHIENMNHRTDYRKPLQAKLNEYGEDDWELFSIKQRDICVPFYSFDCVFKREYKDSVEE